MIDKVPTTKERYFALVEAIGTQHKAGNKEATADLDRLEQLIDLAFGFRIVGCFNIKRIITENSVNNEERDLRLRQLEEEQMKHEKKAADARQEMNELARKYGTPDVFLADTTSAIISSELVSEYVSQL